MDGTMSSQPRMPLLAFMERANACCTRIAHALSERVPASPTFPRPNAARYDPKAHPPLSSSSSRSLGRNPQAPRSALQTIPPREVRRGRAPRRRRRLQRGALHRRHAQPHLAYATQKGLQRKPTLGPKLAAEQLDGKRVKSLDMSFKVWPREVGVALHDVDDDRPPRHDVAVLCLGIETDVAADDLGAETSARVSGGRAG